MAVRDAGGRRRVERCFVEATPMTGIILRACNLFVSWRHAALTGAQRSLVAIGVGFSTIFAFIPSAFAGSVLQPGATIGVPAGAPLPTYKRQRQFAAGGLIGVKFDHFKIQAMVTRDITQANYPGFDTRGWLRLIAPIYLDQPVAAAPPLVTKY